MHRPALDEKAGQNGVEIKCSRGKRHLPIIINSVSAIMVRAKLPVQSNSTV